jgi:hypothetical protein
MALIQHQQRGGPDPAICRVRLAIASLACCLVVVASAQAQQQAQPQSPPQSQSQREFQGGGAIPHQPPQAEPPVEAEPVPSYRPGFLDALGRWFGDPKAVLDSQVRSTQETLGTLGGQAKDAAGNMMALPGTRVITGRQLCPPATNGAPDCQQGVDALCRAKGFESGGRSLDVTSSRRCPARVYLENRAPKEGECRLETYVTRAVCQ